MENNLMLLFERSSFSTKGKMNRFDFYFQIASEILGTVGGCYAVSP